MSFPVLASATQGSRSSNASSTSIAKPSGVQNDDLIIVLLALDDTDTNNSTSTSGWTLTRFAGAGDRLLVIRGWGSASWPLVVSHDSEAAAWQVLRITGADAMPVLSSGAPGSSASPNPPNLNPGLGERDFLWVVAGSVENPQSQYSPTNGPSGYSGYTRTGGGSSNTGTAVYRSWKQARAASEDPDAFTGQASAGTWVAVTIAVPGPEDPPPGAPMRVRTASGWVDHPKASQMRVRTPSGWNPPI